MTNVKYDNHEVRTPLECTIFASPRWWKKDFKEGDNKLGARDDPKGETREQLYY